MGLGIRITPERWAVYFDDDGKLVPAGQGSAPPNTTVFVLRPLPLELSVALRNIEKEGVEEKLTRDAASVCVVGWYGLHDENGRDVPFNAEMLVNGQIPFQYVIQLLQHATQRTLVRQQEDAGKNVRSGSSQQSRSSSGSRGKGRAAAGTAGSNA